MGPTLYAILGHTTRTIGQFKCHAKVTKLHNNILENGLFEQKLAVYERSSEHQNTLFLISFDLNHANISSKTQDSFRMIC